jgi:osmotically inducible lipoprotein OsmB
MGDSDMTVLRFAALAAVAATLAACGHNGEQRAATGALTGAAVAGPVGAVVGGAAGAVANKVDKAN